MRTKIFFFTMLASVAASATVTVTPISTDYAAKKVTFKVVWTNSPTAPYNNRVWIWIDFCPVSGVTPQSFSTATITNPTKSGNGTITGLNGRGFFIEYGATNAGTTVTATLSNAPTGKFNWCAYGSDYPPNAVINGSSYTLWGTPPFVVNGSSLGAGVKSYSGGCITSITDATGCPGLFPLPTTTSLIANTTSICRGASVLLTAAASGAASYSFDNGSSWQTANTKTVSPTATTTYTLKVRSSTGCTSTDSRTVSVSVTQLSAQDEVVNSCGCASGLTKVGSYCRDLVADNAGAYTCNNVVIEVKNTCNNYTTWSSANSACTGIGWRLPTLDELKCLANSSVIIWSVGGGDCYKNTKCEGCDWWLQGNGCRTVVNQGYSCNNCSDCTCVQYNAKYFCVRN